MMFAALFLFPFYVFPLRRLIRGSLEAPVFYAFLYSKNPLCLSRKAHLSPLKFSVVYIISIRPKEEKEKVFKKFLIFLKIFVFVCCIASLFIV